MRKFSFITSSKDAVFDREFFRELIRNGYSYAEATEIVSGCHGKPRRKMKRVNSSRYYEFLKEDDNGLDELVFYAKESDNGYEVTDRSWLAREYDIRIGDFLTEEDIEEMGLHIGDAHEEIGSSRRHYGSRIMSNIGVDDETVVEVKEGGHWEMVSYDTTPEGWSIGKAAKVFPTEEKARSSLLIKKLANAGYSEDKGNLRFSQYNAA